MENFSLYCKSYKTDVRRVVRLAESIQEFNTDEIPFYISTPESDTQLFKEQLKHLNVNLLTDESIIHSNKDINKEKLKTLPGNISQQIVKSEFWRLNLSRSYICLDSDCLFIRPFKKTDFITINGTPYTIIDEGRDLLFPALSQKKKTISSNFIRESKEVQKYFERQGKDYNFGPNCPVWDRRVWESLEAEVLKPSNQSLLDLILISPNEMRWYGEALLKYRAIELLPAQPFFKMYHYAWQLKKDRRNGIKVNQLADLFCGVVFQSAWEREMDWPSEGGTLLSRIARRLRRQLGRS